MSECLINKPGDTTCEHCGLFFLDYEDMRFKCRLDTVVATCPHAPALCAVAENESIVLVAMRNCIGCVNEVGPDENLVYRCRVHAGIGLILEPCNKYQKRKEDGDE